jgi:NAD(P)-dependent dehydrogenase (short-subunit alcohol dehydrogenase family)
MSLTGKIVLICGGNGSVGSGAAFSFVKSGAKVIIPSRSGKDKVLSNFPDLDQTELSHIIPIEGVDISNEKDAAKVRDLIVQNHGGIDHLVTSLGGWWQKGAATKITVEDFDGALKDLTFSHIVAAKTFVPLIRDKEGSSYTIVTGAAGETCYHPDSSLTSIGAAALFGFSAAIRVETEKSSYVFITS